LQALKNKINAEWIAVKNATIQNKKQIK